MRKSESGRERERAKRKNDDRNKWHVPNVEKAFGDLENAWPAQCSQGQ